MNKIKLVDLTFSNINYYNNINKCKFNNGVTLIKGDSCVGKSAIIETLCFILRREFNYE